MKDTAKSKLPEVETGHNAIMKKLEKTLVEYWMEVAAASLGGCRGQQVEKTVIRRSLRGGKTSKLK